MAFTSTTILENRLAGILKIDADDLATYWDDIVSDSLTAGYNDIVSALAGRGYSLSQITSWDRGAEFEKDQGLFWCLVKGAGLTSADDKYIARLDRREELKTVVVTIDGVAVDPAGVVNIGYGDMDTSRETFRRRMDAAGDMDEVKW